MMSSWFKRGAQRRVAESTVTFSVTKYIETYFLWHKEIGKLHLLPFPIAV